MKIRKNDEEKWRKMKKKRFLNSEVDFFEVLPRGRKGVNDNNNRVWMKSYIQTL